MKSGLHWLDLLWCASGLIASVMLQVAASFQQAFPEGCASLCNTLHVRSTGAYLMHCYHATQIIHDCVRLQHVCIGIFCGDYKYVGGREVKGPALLAGLQESVTRQYLVKAASHSSAAPAVAESPSAAKRCPHGPFSGSQASFSVPHGACAPLHALNAITAALETITMVAPPVALTLCISGFEALLQVLSLEHHPVQMRS